MQYVRLQPEARPQPLFSRGFPIPSTNLGLSGRQRRSNGWRLLFDQRVWCGRVALGRLRGHLQWRTELKQFHARAAGAILSEIGYSDGVIARVQALNLKRDFPRDPESRVLEDALCLVFLEHQFAELASKTADGKMIDVLRKTRKKMTSAARALALQLKYSVREKALLDRALKTE